MMKVAYQAGYPTCIIFVDLQAAYHSLVRQLITGRFDGDEHGMELVRNTLKKANLNPSQVDAWLSEGGMAQRAAMPEGLQAMLQELNCDTWAGLQGRVVRTHKGSRPGSPLADALFHCVMSDIVIQLQGQLDKFGSMQRALQVLPIPVDPIVWADDLAVGLIISTNEELNDLIPVAMTMVKSVFNQRGMIVNFGKSKTEALPTYVGSGARHCREEMLRMQDPGWTFKDSQGDHFLRLQARYRHLGAMQQSAGMMEQEVSYRIASTWEAFRQIHRGLLGNRVFKVKTRLQLFQSLILSRLLHGCGSWPELRRKTANRLKTAYMKMLRLTVGQANYKDKNQLWSDERILAEFRQPHLVVLIISTRLTYAFRVHRFGSAAFLRLLAMEEERTTTSWLGLLQRDLLWLAEINGKTWGTSLPELRNHWDAGKKGWKSFVKGAVRRHILQQAIAYQLRRGTQHEIDRPIDKQYDWICHCGEAFETKTGLAVHRRQKHGVVSREYEITKGTVCTACLLQVWTPQRLRAHLQYCRKGEMRNFCFLYLHWQQKFRGEPETPFPTGDLPLPGLRRREALQLAGPKCFGMDPKDRDWAEGNLQLIEDELKRYGIESVDRPTDSVVMETLEMTFNDHTEEWTETFHRLAINNGWTPATVSISLLFWGGMRQWTSSHEHSRWQEMLYGFPWGHLLWDYFDLSLRLAWLDRVQEGVVQPERKKEEIKRSPGENKHLDWQRDIATWSKESLPPWFPTRLWVQAMEPAARLRKLEEALGFLSGR